mmetsp:Transcript_6250/g.15751  ORF Transcript_6250/g.15751 Transcript_6250/m.15751 type:complete len:1302 (+) Transcript_6250:226-4131(+)
MTRTDMTSSSVMSSGGGGFPRLLPDSSKPIPDITLKRAERLQLKRQFRDLVVSLKNYEGEEDSTTPSPPPTPPLSPLPEECEDDEFIELLIEEYLCFLKLRLWVSSAAAAESSALKQQQQQQHAIVSPSSSSATASAAAGNDLVPSSPQTLPLPSFLVDLIWEAHIQVRDGHEYERFCSRYEQHKTVSSLKRTTNDDAQEESKNNNRTNNSSSSSSRRSSQNNVVVGQRQKQGLYDSTLWLYEQAFKESPSSKVYNADEESDSSDEDGDDTSSEGQEHRRISIWPPRFDDHPSSSVSNAISGSGGGGWDSESDDQYVPTTTATDEEERPPTRSNVRGGKNLVLGSDDSYSNAPSDGDRESDCEEDHRSNHRNLTAGRGNNSPNANVRLPRGSKVWVGSHIANLVQDWIEGDQYVEIRWDGFYYRNDSESVQTSEISPVVNDDSHSLRRRSVVGKRGEKVWIVIRHDDDSTVEIQKKSEEHVAVLAQDWCKGDQTVSAKLESWKDDERQPEEFSSDDVRLYRTESNIDNRSPESGRRRTVSLSSVEGKGKRTKSPGPTRSTRPDGKVGKVLKVQQIDPTLVQQDANKMVTKPGNIGQRTKEEKLEDAQVHRSVLLDRVKICKDAAERRLNLLDDKEESDPVDRRPFGFEGGYQLEGEYLAENRAGDFADFAGHDDQLMLRTDDDTNNSFLFGIDHLQETVASSSDVEIQGSEKRSIVDRPDPVQKSRVIRGSLPGERRGKVLLMSTTNTSKTPKRSSKKGSSTKGTGTSANEKKTRAGNSGRTSRIRKPTWKVTNSAKLSASYKTEDSKRSPMANSNNFSSVAPDNKRPNIGMSTRRSSAANAISEPILQSSEQASIQDDKTANEKKQKKRPISLTGDTQSNTVRNVRQKAVPSLLPSPLYQQRDEVELTEYQCLLRKQLVLFEATSEDVVASKSPGRNGMIEEGRVGLRCRHCMGKGDEKKTKGSVYYTASIQGIYQVAQNMGRIHLLDRCPYVPQGIKNALDAARCGVGKKAARAKTNGGKKYWSDSIRAMGCYDEDDGVRCGRQAAMPLLHSDPPRTSSSKMEKTASTGRKEMDATTSLTETFPLPSLGVQDETLPTPPAMQDPAKEAGKSNDLFETMDTYNDEFPGGLPFMDHAPDIEIPSGDAVDESFFAKDFDDWPELNEVSAIPGRNDLFSFHGSNESQLNEPYQHPVHPSFAGSAGLESHHRGSFPHNLNERDPFGEFVPVPQVLASGEGTRRSVWHQKDVRSSTKLGSELPNPSGPGGFGAGGVSSKASEGVAASVVSPSPIVSSKRDETSTK